jgi:hypothetical protein
VRDEVWHPHKTTGKIIVLYTLMFFSSIATWNTKHSAPNDSNHSLTSILT